MEEYRKRLQRGEPGHNKIRQGDKIQYSFQLAVEGFRQISMIIFVTC